MLAALERGITGGKWHSLIDKVWAAGNLEMAGRAVIRKDGSAGVDGVRTTIAIPMPTGRTWG